MINNIGRLAKCVSPGEDDRITIANKATIYVPFGKGQEVYKQILEALKAGNQE